MWNIKEDRRDAPIAPTERNEADYRAWMAKLPRYHVVSNTIFVHAGIDEEAAEDGYWEWSTGEHIFTGQFRPKPERFLILI